MCSRRRAGVLRLLLGVERYIWHHVVCHICLSLVQSTLPALPSCNPLQKHLLLCWSSHACEVTGAYVTSCECLHHAPGKLGVSCVASQPSALPLLAILMPALALYHWS
jgi:hypothetical protein